MTKKIYFKLCQKSFQNRMNLSRKKQNEYTHNSDALDNFKRNAKALKVHPFLVWSIYSHKHWDAIISYVQQNINKKNKKVRTESIESRIDDMQNYLDLFKALIKDERKKK